MRSALELSFPELTDDFPVIRSLVAIQVIRLYTHPDFVVGLTVRQMTDQLYRLIGRHITKKLLAGYCSKIWVAVKNYYPALPPDSIEISIIDMICDKFEENNHRIFLVKVQWIKKAAIFSEFKIICSIPWTGQLNTALLIGFAGNNCRFDNCKQYQSGTLTKLDKINRRGNKAARTVAIEMIQSMPRSKSRIQNHLVDYYYK